MGNGGRPTVRTADVEATILDALRNGHTRVAAAGAAKIARKTLWMWLDEDAEFCNAVREAETEGRFKLEGFVYAGCSATPSLALEVLGRRYPKVWGRKDRVTADVRVADVSLEDDPAARIARVESLLAALKSGETK